MLIAEGFKNRPLRMLWFGQVGSAVGDELFKIAFIWLAVQVLGADTGYLAALQLAVSLAFGFFFGHLADRLRPDSTLIGVDLLRAALVLIPVCFYVSGHSSYVVLASVTIAMAALSTYFEPALLSSLPVLARSPRLLRAGNGLMATTYRLARVFGPFLVSVLSGLIPIHHFFTLDAISFVFSALLIRSLKKEYDEGCVGHVHEPKKMDVIRTLREVRKHPNVYRALVMKTLGSGPWGVVYGVGLALLARELEQEGLRAFGWIMASYGVGNVTSALIFGNFHRRNPEPWVYIGFGFIGVSFVLIAFSPTLPWICLFSALCAVGGPMNDTPFLEMMQERFPHRSVTPVIRLRMVFDSLCTLMFTLVSPFLFKTLGVRGTIGALGVFSSLLALMAIPTWRARLGPDT
ncbi:MAG: MFS transporter [Bdellovibrionales bacterium]|nr:MFS transporter [Bdellovibrionales bacterium]